jgi:hypothetical protein
MGFTYRFIIDRRINEKYKNSKYHQIEGVVCASIWLVEKEAEVAI